MSITLRSAIYWRFDGEAPVQVISGDKVFYERHYAELVPQGEAIKSPNLARSDSDKADVSSNDLLAYWADDPRTEVVGLYLESFGNPRKFARIAPEVARHKPIVVVKSGCSAAGTRAASRHSAALDSLDVAVAALLATQPIPPGSRIGVVTNAGGPGILLADACAAHGLTVPELTLETQTVSQMGNTASYTQDMTTKENHRRQGNVWMEKFSPRCLPQYSSLNLAIKPNWPHCFLRLTTLHTNAPFLPRPQRPLS